MEHSLKTGGNFPKAMAKVMFNLLPVAPGQTATKGDSSHQDRLRTSSSATSPARTMSVQSGRLRATRFVVMGEGLAAGMGDFGLSRETQIWSFPAQMAKQMEAQLVQQ